MMKSLTIPQRDKGYPIVFTLTDANAVAYNLSSYTNVNFKMWTPTNITPLINADCTVSNAAGGVVYYTPVTNDFNVSGTYYAEIEATTATIKLSTETFKLIISESA